MITKGLPKVLKQVSVAKAIVRSLEETYPVNRKNRLHAGDAGFCSRQSVLNASYQGEGRSDAKSMLYMKIGSAVHDLVQNGLYKAGHLMFKEYRVADIGINLGGYIDAIVFLEDRLMILEFKTAGSTLPGDIKEGHRQQATIYSAITGLEAQVVYISRNVAGYDGNVLIKAIPMVNTKEMMADVMFQAAYSHFALNMGVVGPVPAHMLESKCGYCGYKQFCWHGAGVPDTNAVKPATVKQHKELIGLAKEVVDEMVDPVKMDERRNSVLSYLSKNGTEHAQKLLATREWSELFRHPF